MTLIASIVGWIGRHILLFILILIAMIGYAQFQKSSREADQLEASLGRLESAEARLDAMIMARRHEAVTGLKAAERQSLDAIEARLGEARAELAALPKAGLDPLALITAPEDAIVADFRNRIEAERLRQEIAFLEALHKTVSEQGEALSLDGQIRDQQKAWATLDAAHRKLVDALKRVEGLPLPEQYRLEGFSLIDIRKELRAQMDDNVARRDDIQANIEQLQELQEDIGVVRDLAVPTLAIEGLRAQIAPLSEASRAQSARLEATAEREARRWYQQLGIADLLKPALITLLLIIVTPFAIRTLFYWVLAPIATGRGAIRLLQPSSPVPLPATGSSVSKSIRLAPEIEVLVKQGYEQTSSDSGDKATQMFVDSRFPFTSLVSGLWFLMRIRGGPADTVTVSARDDPFAEVALLDIPDGASMVLQPRAIAGVIQPRSQPLRITSHWRLGTLNAWLTWQLRFLAFHGPATLILKGGRGVRFEPAEAGRIIGQDQVIGFSPGLAYTATRTQTFLPYLFGQESLLKDRVAAGDGLLVAEESPMAGRSAGARRKGLEGAVDAALKAFGI